MPPTTRADITPTWDTADPSGEIEEIFREAQAAGRLVYRQTRRRHRRTGAPRQLEP
jgi:hypothetical protein